ncbi:G-protein coupled receptor moody-like [Apostichopus japonicus]|uniref:G-protein coupled receptor moody-like n=1 Tax=Stichopus japonicus TaxID=307972 RepID=UPI003AB90852
MKETSDLHHSTSSTYSLQSVPGQKMAISILLCVVTVVGIVGNILVVVAVVRFRTLWTPTNKFIASLAVSNLISCATVPYHITTILGEPPKSSNNNNSGCTAIAAIAISVQVISLLTLALIAVCRVMLVRGKVRTYDKIYTNRNVFIMIAISWALTFVVVTSASLLDIAKLGYNIRYKACLVVSSDSGHSSLAVGLVVGIPIFLIIVISYVLIFMHLRKHHQELKSKLPGAHRKKKFVDLASDEAGRRTTEEEQEPNSLETISEVVPQNTSRITTPVTVNKNICESDRKQSATEQAISSRQNKVTRNLFVIVCVFVVCVMPFCVAIIIPGVHVVVPWFALLFLSNNALNPILYGFLHPPLRQAFAKLLSYCRNVNSNNNSQNVSNITSLTHNSI